VSTDERLSPKRRLAIGALALVMAGGGFAIGRPLFRETGSVSQPIQFNHERHVKTAGLECSACHEYFNTSEHSGLPSLDTCEGCHAEAVTESPEEGRLRALFASSPRPEFKKLFRLPDHVYYSHQRHVAAGGLACENCHGAIAETTSPPTSPLRRITMATCLDCHAERGVKTDCTGCHH
jgi:hypothetical protein